MSNVAVYTASLGAVDDLQPHVEIPGVDFIAFTDTFHEDTKGWEVRGVDAYSCNPRLAHKWYKVMPHLVLPEHELTLWVDGNCVVASPDVCSVFDLLDGVDVAQHVHPDRDCIYDEANASDWLLKYQGQPIQEQVAHYRHELGHPEHWGLWATGSIARRRGRQAAEMGVRWLREQNRWTNQDQLSQPVVLREMEFTPAPFPHNLWEDPWLEIVGHRTQL